MKYFIYSEVVIRDEVGNRVQAVQSLSVPIAPDGVKVFREKMSPVHPEVQAGLEKIRDKTASLLEDRKILRCIRCDGEMELATVTEKVPDIPLGGKDTGKKKDLKPYPMMVCKECGWKEPVRISNIRGDL